MTPPKVARINLSQIASSQQDAIIFDANTVQSLTNEQDVFLIFYLSKDDEYNGYGTVIQLDPQTKQAAIYSDLNPEYTYLFFKNDQDQLQSLLWCIEVATRTSDGLFIAHAKSYGRGITEEDLQRFNSGELNQPQTQPTHQLAEENTPLSPPASTPAAPSNVAQPETPVMESTPPAQPTFDTRHDSPPIAQPQGDPSQPGFTPPQSPTATSQPGFEQPQPPQGSPQLDKLATAPMSAPFQEQSVSPTAAPTPALENSQQQSDPSTTQEAMPADLQVDQPTTPPSPAEALTSNPPLEVAPTPAIMDIPDIFSSASPSYTVDTQNPTPKQPVGRPQKQLITDQLWPVSQQDFSWAKNMSRSAMSTIKDELWEKVMYQIRVNQPGLIEDWEFQGALEAAFTALCATYDLIPALRHDILKSLLNGRVVDSINRQKSNRNL